MSPAGFIWLSWQCLGLQAFRAIQELQWDTAPGQAVHHAQLALPFCQRETNEHEDRLHLC